MKLRQFAALLGALVLLLSLCSCSGSVEELLEAATKEGRAARGELNLDEIDCPEGYWVYDGRLFEQLAEPGSQDYQPYMLVRRSTEVWGYDALSLNAQYAFDLLYNGYFIELADQHDVTFWHFTMPQPLTNEEWSDVTLLYEAATISYSYYRRLYQCGDDTVGKVNCLGDECPCKWEGYRYHFNTSQSEFSDDRLNRAYNELEEKADEILAQTKPGWGDHEIARYLAETIIGGATYYTDNYIGDRVQVGDFTIHRSEEEFITAYGVLLLGEGNCFGYARAFDYLAKRAGLNTAVVLAWNENDIIGHAWNLVEVDGRWYQLDTTWIDTETDEPDWRWFLFEGGETEHDYYNIQTYSWLDYPLPQCETAPHPSEV